MPNRLIAVKFKKTASNLTNLNDFYSLFGQYCFDLVTQLNYNFTCITYLHILLLLLSTQECMGPHNIIVLGLTEGELHHLLTLQQIALDSGLDFTVHDVRNICIPPEKKIPSMIYAQLITSLKSFLRPLGNGRYDLLS